MDNTGGYYGAMAILTALYHRNETGEGQYLDLAQVEAAINLSGTAALDSQVNRRPNRGPHLPAGNRLPSQPAAPHGIYPAAGEDRWLAIAVTAEAQWAALRRVMGDPPWAAAPEFATMAARVEHEDELDRRVAEWTVTRHDRETMDELQAAGVPAAIVQYGEDILEHDPQLQHTKFFEWLEHPVVGRTRYNRPVVQLSRTPGRIRGRSPLHGEHTREVLQEVLAMTDVEIDAAERAGAFYPIEPAGTAK
jgi:crotonobetainyl-CoA:carnitine CoA-transferase CaiB-like acyl-CoA transferase